MGLKKTFLLLIFPMLIFGSYSRAEIVERIVARINDEIITLTEMEEVYQGLTSAFPEGEGLPSKRELLERMVENKLLLQEAKSQGIKVSEGEVQENIGRIKSTFFSAKAFEFALEQEGIEGKDLEKRYKEELMIKKLIDREVKSRVEISKKEIREYYKKNERKFRKLEMVEIRHILFADYSRAVKALERLNSGVEFGEVAKEEGMLKEGYLGSFKRGQLDRKIEEVAFDLRDGGISSIIQTESNYHIIKLEQKEEVGLRKLSEVRGEIRNFLSSQRMEKKLEEYLEELKKTQTIEIKL